MEKSVHVEAFAPIPGAEPCDIFSILGRHKHAEGVNVSCFVPGAELVWVADRAGRHLLELQRCHESGVFTGHHDTMSIIPDDYRLHVSSQGYWYWQEDPYRFPPMLASEDAWLFAEGKHERAWHFLGAHPRRVGGVEGIHFAVWAPNARRVAVTGDFNHYDNRTHVLRFHPANGIWEMFVPGPGIGCQYRFEVMGADGVRRQKIDPYGRAFVTPADSVAVVPDDDFTWHDETWLSRRDSRPQNGGPVSIYEVHAGSWRADCRDYKALAVELVDYARDMGFTHIELLPLSEHPFTGSWGYQPTGMFAPTARFGPPEALRSLVDTAHEQGIGVLLDWVPAHFPADAHGLAEYDGTALYEHADPMRGQHPDWGTMIYNYGRAEVVNFLVSSALYWIEEFHIDGLRVDAVASMLYLDYSREAGEWSPNIHGGRENLEAVTLVRRVNDVIQRRHPGVLVIAEESTAWPGVTAPLAEDGLGFSLKWNMGWMHDTLEYMKRDPVHRRHHHGEITFSMVYAYSERYVLPLSHDEVVHGKASLLGKMPGDAWQKFANLRLLYSYMWTHPGRKLLFMGGEIAQQHEWNHDNALEWNLLNEPAHGGIQHLVRDLNQLLRTEPALYAADDDPAGFRWLIEDDAGQSVLAFARAALDNQLIVICNFTPVVRHDYLIPVQDEGRWTEVLNTDSRFYGGGNLGNSGTLQTVITRDGNALRLLVPPLATLVLRRQ